MGFLNTQKKNLKGIFFKMEWDSGELDLCRCKIKKNNQAQLERDEVPLRYQFRLFFEPRRVRIFKNAKKKNLKGFFFLNGAGDEARTRDILLGKEAFYH